MPHRESSPEYYRKHARLHVLTAVNRIFLEYQARWASRWYEFPYDDEKEGFTDAAAAQGWLRVVEREGVKYYQVTPRGWSEVACDLSYDVFQMTFGMFLPYFKELLAHHD